MTHAARTIVLIMLVLGSLNVASASGEQIADNKKDRDVLNATVVAPPSPVVGTDEKQHLVYEIVMDNPMRSRVRVDRLVVRDVARDTKADGWSGRDIKSVMFGIDASGGSPTRTLAPDQVGVLLLDVRLSKDEVVPERLRHHFELSFKRDGARPRRVTMQGAATQVRLDPSVIISPPLEGNDVASANSGPAFL